MGAGLHERWLIQSDRVMARNDLQLVYSIANRVKEHWQVDERKTGRHQEVIVVQLREVSR